ncbi:uncharacterized protein K489DRAFT_375306 [Dissoconium aciculare CBS 342.82]|uniref:Uncharacterized protein n=1 Tax=Dissoconium aciculare CBS 342.82 TaxID=1314786 RepID=A0A6J3MH00_9PEZI|nr:uncharacterized protein K489DRAFT_375306 [Dissoconium aciculare CBS 342.82]KAF1827220.1 hypothetical protein K489DRAFT_375306 [Dissoconium aciculare CBS 342.82]
MAIARLDLDNTRKTVSEVFAAAQIADEDDNDDNFKFNQWAGAERKEDRRQSLGIDLKRLATIAQVTYIESRQADRIKALRKVVEKTEVDRNDADQQQKELLRRVHDLEELAKNYRSDMAAATKQSSDLTVFKELLTAVKELMAAVTKERSSDMALVKELLSAMAKERSSDMAIVKELLAATTKQSGTVKQSRGNMITATRETIDPEAMQALKDEITTLKQELENLRPIKRFLDNHYAHRNTSTKDKSESGITEGSRSSRQDDQTGSSIPRHDSQSRLLDVFKPDTGASQDQLKNRHSDSTLRTARDMSHKLFRKLPGSKTSLHH